jgi:hypothetical protein
MMKLTMGVVAMSVVAIAAGIGTLLFFIPISRPMAPSLHTKRLQNVVLLRNALKDFSETEERLPRNLTELATHVSSRTNLGWFYGPEDTLDGSYQRPRGWETNVQLLDQYSCYFYSPTCSATWYLHERRGIWKGLTTGVLLIATNFDVRFVPTQTVVECRFTNATALFPNPKGVAH